MENNPKVSVIIPTYNRPERLQRALSSIRSQTYDNIEAVVVDDHSETSMSEIAGSFSPSLDVKFIRHEQNKGANPARNTGIKNSSGQYIAFLDDDDTWVEEKLELQVDKIENSDAGVIYSGIRHVGADGTTLSKRTPVISGEVTNQLLKENFVGSFSTVLVDVDVIHKTGLPDEDFPIWQDWEWYIRLSKNSKFECVSEILVNHNHGEYNRISGNIQSLEAEALPLFLKKFSEEIEDGGIIHTRKIYSSIFANVARYGLSTGNFDKARRHAAGSLSKYPMNYVAIACLVFSLRDGFLYRIYKKVERNYLT